MQLHDSRVRVVETRRPPLISLGNPKHPLLQLPHSLHLRILCFISDIDSFPSEDRSNWMRTCKSTAKIRESVESESRRMILQRGNAVDSTKARVHMMKRSHLEYLQLDKFSLIDSDLVPPLFLSPDVSALRRVELNECSLASSDPASFARSCPWIESLTVRKCKLKVNLSHQGDDAFPAFAREEFVGPTFFKTISFFHRVIAPLVIQTHIQRW